MDVRTLPPQCPTALALPLPGSGLSAEALTRASALRAKKERAVAEALRHIEAGVDSYLTKNYGYRLAAIPDNYLDEPPRDLAAVETNLSILHHCLSDMFLPGSHTTAVLLEPLRVEVYATYLTPLMREMEEQLAAAGAATNSQLEALRKDLNHLRAMRDGEEGFLQYDDVARDKPRAGPADVVPVGGLIAGRLHRLANEAGTVLGHWSRHSSGYPSTSYHDHNANHIQGDGADDGSRVARVVQRLGSLQTIAGNKSPLLPLLSFFKGSNSTDDSTRSNQPA